jgi:hypothetical protein
MEKILINEDARGIASLRNFAAANATHLNAITAIRPELNSEPKILDAAANSKHYVQELFFEIYPAGRDQLKYSSIKFNYPDHLQALETLLQKTSVRSFEMVLFNSKAKAWQPDTEDIDQRSEVYRQYASGAEQVSRYKFSKQVADYLNNQLRPGSQARKRFLESEIVTNVVEAGQLTFAPNPRFIFSDYTY